MRLSSDSFRPTPAGGRCRLRIFEPDDPGRDAFVVVCTEPKDNAGESVTNAAEKLAAAVIEAERLPVPVVWIEHYEDGARGTVEDPHTFDLVVFSHYDPRDAFGADGWHRRIGEPTWKALDRESTEALVGATL